MLGLPSLSVWVHCIRVLLVFLIPKASRPLTPQNKPYFFLRNRHEVVYRASLELSEMGKNSDWLYIYQRSEYADMLYIILTIIIKLNEKCLLPKLALPVHISVIK